MKKTLVAVFLLVAVLATACGTDADTVDNEQAVVTAEGATTKEAEAVTEEPAVTEADPEDGEPAENLDAYDKPEENKTDAAAIMEGIAAAVELPEMYTGDDAHILNNYGIDPAELDSYAVSEALEVTLADKIVLIDPAEGTDRNAIIDKLENFRQEKAMEMEDYLPEQYDVIAAASVKEKGDIICLVISPEAEKIESIIDDMTGK